MTPEDKRLDRIEEKLDRMTEALESLARIDERMISLFKRMDNYDTNQQELSKRITNLESGAAKSTVKMDWVERVVWVVVIGGVSLFFSAGLTV